MRSSALQAGGDGESLDAAHHIARLVCSPPSPSTRSKGEPASYSFWPKAHDGGTRRHQQRLGWGRRVCDEACAGTLTAARRRRSRASAGARACMSAGQAMTELPQGGARRFEPPQRPHRQRHCQHGSLCSSHRGQQVVVGGVANASAQGRDGLDGVVANGGAQGRDGLDGGVDNASAQGRDGLNLTTSPRGVVSRRGDFPQHTAPRARGRASLVVRSIARSDGGGGGEEKECCAFKCGKILPKKLLPLTLVTGAREMALLVAPATTTACMCPTPARGV